MTELEAIRRSSAPVTTKEVSIALANLGVRGGDVLVVHSSLSAIGWVVGGPQAILDALVGSVGPAGTVTMPAHSGGLSEPSNWQNPAVPSEWWDTIRSEMSPFDVHLTPLREMGAVAEAFHRMPGTLRSNHPTVSHLARGPLAERITARHQLEYGLGEASPLGRLYEVNAKIVLIGVDHDNNTSLHLAENRADWQGREVRHQGSPVIRDGLRQWVTYDELDPDTDDFIDVGRAHAAAHEERVVTLGAGLVRCIDMRSLVDFATTWFARHRGTSA